MYLRLKPSVEGIDFANEFTEMELLVYSLIVRSSDDTQRSYILYRQITEQLEELGVTFEEPRQLSELVNSVCSKTFNGSEIIDRELNPTLPNGNKHRGTRYTLKETPLLYYTDNRGDFVIEPKGRRPKKSQQKEKRPKKIQNEFNTQYVMGLFKREYVGKFGKPYVVEDYPKEMSQLKQAFVTSGLTKKQVIKIIRTIFQYYDDWSKLPLNVGSLVGQKILFENAKRVIEGTYKGTRDTLFIELGFMFENLLEDVLNELGLEYETQRSHVEYLYPDFVLKGDRERWIDAKLSEGTVFQHETIEKYTPHCQELTIVFLNGDKNKFEQINEKVRLVSVFRLIDDIEDKSTRYKLKERFEKLQAIVETVKHMKRI